MRIALLSRGALNIGPILEYSLTGKALGCYPRLNGGSKPSAPALIRQQRIAEADPSEEVRVSDGDVGRYGGYHHGNGCNSNRRLLDPRERRVEAE